LLALFCLEAVLFFWHVSREIAPFYPSNFDQLSYYLNTYDLIEQFRTSGWSAFVTTFLQPGHATGVTFVIQGALLSLVGGANRTALISINLLYFLALQLVLFHTVRARTGNINLAWVAVAILLSFSTVFNVVGGIYDYRIDFAAMCLYGIWICFILWSGTFRNRGLSLIVGIIGSLLILLRFFTVIYVATVMGGILLAGLYGMRGKTRSNRVAAATRTFNVLAAGVITALIVLPRLVAARDALYNYYFVGHVLSDEKYIRAHELGIYSLRDHLLYYPLTIISDHIGNVAGKLMALILGLAIFARVLAAPMSGLLHDLTRYRMDLFGLGLAVAFPILILTADIAKSSVVGGIVAVPIILIIILLCAATLQPTMTSMKSVAPRQIVGSFLTGGRFTAWIPLLFIVVAGAGFTHQSMRKQQLASRPDLERITLINEAIIKYAIENHMPQPTISFDRVVDYLNWGTPKLFAIERFHRYLNFDPRFGHGLYGVFETPRAQALRLFSDSDIIVLTDPIAGRSHPYPMNAKIREYWNELWTWTNQNRKLIFATEILGIPHRVFVRMPANGATPRAENSPLSTIARLRQTLPSS
jgi:hypothetical protein